MDSANVNMDSGRGVFVYSADQLHAMNYTPRISTHLLQELRKLKICRPKYKQTKRGCRGGKRKHFSKLPKIVDSGDDKGSNPCKNNDNVKKWKSDCLQICYTNARSVCNKGPAFYEYIVTNDVDIFIITETWLLPPPRDEPVLKSLKPEGYDHLSVDRNGNRGGGILIVFKIGISIKETIPQKFSSFENLSVTIELQNQRYCLVCVYRTGSKRGFFEECQDFLTEKCLLPEKLLIVGDFNLHMNDNTDSNVKQFENILHTLNLVQMIKEPTHEKGNILDLLIIRANDSTISSPEVIHESMSDHCIIKLFLNQRKPRPPTKTIVTRNFKRVNMNELRDAMVQSDLTDTVTKAASVTEKLCAFNNVVIDILDKFAPAKRKKIVIRPNTQWFCEEIKTAKKHRRCTERQWRKTRLQVHFEIFKKAKQDTNKLISECKRKYVKNSVIDKRGDPKGLSRIVSGLMRNEQSASILPKADNMEDLAEDFSTFFRDKIDKIRNGLGSATQPSVPPTSCEKVTCVMNCFETSTEKEIVELVKSSPNKSCSLDTVPTWLIRDFIDILAPSIVSIVNVSLTSADVPPELKQALVTPLLKKPSLDKDNLSNYRPVSNLNFLSKIIEKVVAKRLRAHLKQNDLFPKYQSAYREHHSTETAMLRVQNDILKHIDRGNCVALVLLDLSAAFDTIDHKLLLDRLEKNFGISSKALHWVSSYMENRTQSVRLDPGPSPTSLQSGTVTSQPARLSCGVPQGSILGPLLFTLYTAPLVNVISRYNGIEHHLYADDTQLCVPIPRDQVAASLENIEKCCSEIKQWMTSNMLKLNDSKTEVLLLGKDHQRRRIHIDKLKIGDSEIKIETTSSVRNLGFFLDSDISSKTHVSKICQSSHFHLRNIGKIRKMLDSDTTKTLVQSLVVSKIDYCNALLLNAPSTTIDRLQKIQNRAARLVTLSRPREHITPVLRSLHWLPVKERISFKICCIIYKCLNDLAPEYLSELLELYVPPRPLRSQSQQHLSLKYGRLDISERAFPIGGPKLWNKLDMSIRNSENLNIFKKRLKTHHFRNYYKL